MTLYIVGFDDLVTSFVATIATGWSDPCRVVGIEVRRAVHLRVRWLIPRFPMGPQSGSHHAHGRDRNRARLAVGEGFPFPLFRLRNGFTVSPWRTVPDAPL